MKRVIAFLMLLMFGAVVVGCESSMDPGPDEHGKTTYKKTTVTEPDGDTHVKTETKKNTSSY